jgi:hypothetical protein
LEEAPSEDSSLTTPPSARQHTLTYAESRAPRSLNSFRRRAACSRVFFLAYLAGAEL